MKGLGLGTTERTLEPPNGLVRAPWEAPRGHDPCRHQTARPGFLSGSAHRINGDRPSRLLRGAATKKGARPRSTTPPAWPYVEVLADEQKGDDVVILARAVGWFLEQGISPVGGILSDNGPPNRSGDCESLSAPWISAHPTPALQRRSQRE